MPSLPPIYQIDCYNKQTNMGNEHCCDERDKAGDFNSTVTKVNNRKLQRIGTKDVEQSFEKKQTKQTIASNNQINQNNAEVKPIISTSFLKQVDQPRPQDHEQGSPKITGKNQPQEGQANLSFSRSEKKHNSILKINPELNEEVRTTYQTEKFFEGVELKNELREYGDQIYEGNIEKNMPNGFGKFYKKDQSLYIGYFQDGKAHGQGVFIFPNGSYFKGSFQENKTCDQVGEFHSKDLTFRGEFKNNLFHGKGEETSPNHEFKGEYSNGKKASGSLIWRQGYDQFIYEGTFNEEGQLHGKGNMKEPTGTYEGEFENGAKHGFGRYKYVNKIVYEGNYIKNQRQGHGRLINPDSRLAYEGNFQKGLPHGEGIVHSKEGIPHNSRWIMGIDQDLL